MTRAVAILVAGACGLVIGCGSSPTAGRSAASVVRCLAARNVATRDISRTETFLETISPRPRTLLEADRVQGLIALYATTGDAAGVFSRVRTTFPALQEGNAIVLSMTMPQPTPAQLTQLEVCAFGPNPRPAVGPMVTTGRVRPGRVVMLDSGCLACHRIAGAGNGGPGPDLSHIGTQLSAAAIARELRHPTAPMPRFGDLSPHDFRALVAYLSALR